MLYADANLAAVAAQNDQRSLTLDGHALAVETAGPFNIAQITFIPMPEAQLNTSVTTISPSTNTNVETIIAITITSNNTVIVYDQHEDGYEADIRNPIQASTLIWGDGDLTNGVAPGTANDLLNLGSTILLRNQVPIGAPLTMDYDGRDKIGSNKAIAVTRAGWNVGTGTIVAGTIVAGAINVIDVGNAGTTYTVPVGTNTVAGGGFAATAPNPQLFEYTSLHIIAYENGTTVRIDKDNNGVFETTVALNQGEAHLVSGGVLAGGTVVADKGIGVYMIAGDIGQTENRWFNGSPVWVTAAANTWLYVDSATVAMKDGAGAAVAGVMVDADTYRYPVTRLQSYRLPAPYFLLTFTLPAEFRALARTHPREVYDLLMRASWQTLRTFSQNDRQLKATLGATAVLHTQTRQLDFHPHVHRVVPAAALEAERGLWRCKRRRGAPAYLFNGRALAKVFRAKMLAGLAAPALALPGLRGADADRPHAHAPGAGARPRSAACPPARGARHVAPTHQASASPGSPRPRAEGSTRPESGPRRGKSLSRGALRVLRGRAHAQQGPPRRLPPSATPPSGDISSELITVRPAGTSPAGLVQQTVQIAARCARAI